MMSPIHFRPGLRPTFRDFVALLLYLASMSGLIVWIFHDGGVHSFPEGLATVTALFLLTCFGLPALILLLDRREPARRWYALIIFWVFMMGTTLLGWFCFYTEVLPLRSAWRTQFLYGSPILFAACVARLTLDFLPSVCPCCGMRGLVPTETPSRITRHVRWCANCGRRSSKLGRGEWHPL